MKENNKFEKTNEEIDKSLKYNKYEDTKRALRINKQLAKRGSFEHNWGIYDSDLFSIGKTFKSCLPQEIGTQDKDIEVIFKDYIEDTLSKGKKNELTAVEFGGSGSRLFEGFTKNFFTRTAGVCLKDIRDQKLIQNDTMHHHGVVEGDITGVQDTRVLDLIKETLETEKIDLIISRMVAPVGDIVHNPAILDRIIRNWYSLLAENGLMFIQFNPWNSHTLSNPNTNLLIQKWAKDIQQKFPEVKIQVELEALRLHKKFGSPERLPSTTELYK